MDINDPREVKREHKRRQRLDAQRRGDNTFVMSDERGRRFMYELIFHRLGLQSVYEQNDAGLQRNEGKRSVAVKLAQELQAENPDAYILMITERMAFVKANQAAQAAETETGADDAS